MKKYIFSLVCLCCALLPALEGQAPDFVTQKTCIL